MKARDLKPGQKIEVTIHNNSRNTEPSPLTDRVVHGTVWMITVSGRAIVFDALAENGQTTLHGDTDVTVVG
jgi:hypothetical protein